MRPLSEYSIAELHELISSIDEHKHAETLIELRKELNSRETTTPPEGYLRYEKPTRILFKFSWISFIGFIQLFMIIGVLVFYANEFESTNFAQSIPEDANDEDVVPLFAPLMISMFFIFLGSFFIIARKRIGVYFSSLGYLFQLVAFHTETIRYYMILLVDLSIFYSPDGGLGFSTSLNPLNYELNVVEESGWFIQLNLFTLALILIMSIYLRKKIKKKKKKAAID